MPVEKKSLHPEVNFLPPLDMVLSFFDKESKKRNEKKSAMEEQKDSNEKSVEKLIEKLSEKEK